jgi:hypothetical protein
MAKRVFVVPIIVLVDDDERDDPETAPATFDDVREYLADAIMLDIDTEEYGNPVGFQSAATDTGQMTELSPEEAANYLSN